MEARLLAMLLCLLLRLFVGGVVAVAAIIDLGSRMRCAALIAYSSTTVDSTVQSY